MNPSIHNPTPSQQFEDARKHAITAVCMRCAATVTLIPFTHRDGTVEAGIDAYSMTCYNAGHRLIDFTLDLDYHQRDH